ncbi:hypothetical protein ACTXGQ_19630 [Marinobacter sp. 1Y8]
MWKHVIASSIQAAFAGAMLLILVSMPAYGGAATIFGVIAFPIAVFWCLVLAYPLIKLRQAIQLREYAWLAVYSVVGFVFGAITPVLMFGPAGTEFSVESASLLSLYGLLGTTCAASAWNYVRRHVSL